MITSSPVVTWLENVTDSRQIYKQLLLALSIVGTLLFLSSTREGGLKITPDAINYMAAARSLINGNGLIRYHEAVPFVHWGPLYPVFLAPLDLISRVLPFDFLETIRLTNAILYGVIIFLSGRLFLRYIRLQAIALVAVIWVMCSFTLFNRTMFPLSESLFYVLTLLVVLYWPRIFEPNASIRHFIILGVLVALIPLQRFAGYSIIPIVMISIIFFKHDTPLTKRLRLAALFMITSLPMLLWLFYGQTTASYRRLRSDPVEKILDSLQRTPQLIYNWFLPYETYTLLVGIIVVALIMLIIFWLHRRYYFIQRMTRTYPDLKNYPLLVAQYVLIFLAGLFFAFVSSGSPLDARHISVLYIFVMVLIFYAIEQLIYSIRVKWLITLVIVVVALGTLYRFERIYHLTSIPCCKGNSQREVDLVQWLQHNPLGPGRYYSNTPLPLMYSNLSVSAAPESLEEWRTLSTRGTDVYLVWFDADDPAQLYGDGLDSYYYPLAFDPQQLAQFGELSVLADLSHGQIFRLQIS